MAMTALTPGVVQSVSTGYYVFPMSPRGSLSVQVISTSSLKLKFFATNDSSLAEANVSPVPFSVTNTSGVTAQTPGDELTPAALDWIDAVFGDALYAVVQVTGGSGQIAVNFGNGTKLV